MSKFLQPDQNVLMDFDLEIARMRQDIAESMAKMAHIEYERAMYAATGVHPLPSTISFRDQQIRDYEKSYVHN